jgi:hypothetical protein
MTMMYEPPIPRKQPPKEVLQKHLDSVRERIAQIDLLLQTGTHLPFQTQELRSEREIHLDTKADLERAIDPPKADADIAKLEAESRALQAEQMRRDHAPEPQSVIDERKRNAAIRREALLDLEEKEATGVLMNQIERFEKEGLYSQAKLYRVQLARLRRDLEERNPL